MSKGAGRFVLRVSSSEAAGPSGAGSRAEVNARNPRAPSDIKLATPRGYRTERSVKPKYRFLHETGGRYYWDCRVPGNTTVVEIVSCDRNWFWNRHAEAAFERRAAPGSPAHGNGYVSNSTPWWAEDES